MHLHQSVREVLQQLAGSIRNLPNEIYANPNPVLSGASIGQHTRHVVELFACLDAGYETGIVDYDARERNREIETNPVYACSLILDIAEKTGKENKELLLQTLYKGRQEKVAFIDTNYDRELLYNLEHAVHHMALIRIGLASVAITTLPESFGVAASTLQYRESCAQ